MTKFFFLLVLLPFILFSLADGTLAASIETLRVYKCPNNSSEITCLINVILVKKWVCGEGEYRSVNKNIVAASENSCEKLMELNKAAELLDAVKEEIKMEKKAELYEALKEEIKAEKGAELFDAAKEEIKEEKMAELLDAAKEEIKTELKKKQVSK